MDLEFTAMLTTGVIGLREGLEAALIVGIVAAFLRKQGRADALRWMWAGIAVAVVICIAVAVGLDVLSHDLPQKQQEGLETVIGVIAVGMVTYMIVWMRQHARDLKTDLESAASGAVRRGSAIALAAMAFLAVLREGLETAVFLLAAFNASHNAVSSSVGAIIGIAIAIALGYGIYRGGVRINLSKFFRATGLVLVAVAAGLVMTALRTAHEAGWLNYGQQSTVDLSAIVAPGTIRASLLTGVLGLQSKPVLIEVAGWLAYILIVGTVVAWPAGRAFTGRLGAKVAAAGAVIAAVGAAVAVLAAPNQPEPALPASRAIAMDTQITTSGLLAGRTVTPAPERTTVALRAATAESAFLSINGGKEITLKHAADDPADTYSGVAAEDSALGLIADRPTALTLAQVLAAGGGRLPLGVKAQNFAATEPVSYDESTTITAQLDPTRSGVRSIDQSGTITASIHPAESARITLGKVANIAATTDPAAASAARDAIDAHAATADRHSAYGVHLPFALGAIAVVLGILATVLLIRATRTPPQRFTTRHVSPQPVRSSL